MIWFVLIGMIVICAITVHTYARAQRRAMEARVEGVRPQPLSAAQLQANLLALGRDPAILATETGAGRTVITWDLDAATGLSAAEGNEDHLTQMIELAIRNVEQPVVEARFAVGEVSLEANEAGEVSPTVAWDWPLIPEFGDAMTETPIGRRTMAALAAPVRKVVLDAGYAWQPTITREAEVPDPA